MTTRRDLLQIAACAAAGAVLPDALAVAADTKPEPKTKTLLILGGTGFIGPHLTQEAQRLNWKVTHFNRGKRAADGVPGVETLIGDRKGQLDSLQGAQVGRRDRRHRLHPEVREDVRRAAGAERRLLPVHLEHLGLREFREAQ